MTSLAHLVGFFFAVAVGYVLGWNSCRRSDFKHMDGALREGEHRGWRGHFQ